MKGMNSKMKKFRIKYEETIEREAVIVINDDNVEINSNDDLMDYLRKETFYNTEFLEEEEVSGDGPDIDTVDIIEFL